MIPQKSYSVTTVDEKILHRLECTVIPGACGIQGGTRFPSGTAIKWYSAYNSCFDCGRKECRVEP